LIALALLYFVLFYDRDQSSLRPAEIDFAIEDTARIQAIRLTRLVKGSPTAEVSLQRQADQSWQLNGKYPALQLKVNQLMKVLHLMQLKEVLQGEGIESANKILRTLHTRVEVSDQSGIFKTYLVGTETKDGTGTLMKLASAELPYIVEMPGLQGYLNASFPVDTAIWRENLLFPAQLERISSISISYPEFAQSLTLSRSSQQGSWQLLGSERPLDSLRLNAYLSLFQGKIYAETFASEFYPRKKAQLETEAPDILFEVGYFSGETRRIPLFTREDNLNNYFGWVEGKTDLLTIQRFVIDRFLRKRSDFLPPNL
jgi:hypothetical protein